MERELWGLLLLVLCCYAPRLTEITIRGEESRRGRIAWEMYDTGDWVVPRIQGGVVFFRPPLQNWLIALVGKLRGEIDTFAVRLPTLIAMFLTVTLIYAYARTFMSRLGAFAAGTVFATFAQVLELGRLGETEGLFTLFVAGSLLVWKSLLNRNAPALLLWCSGYALTALATLTKGPQAPLYFVPPVVVYLLLTRRFRLLFSVSHFAGLVAFLAIVAAWQIPFAEQVGATQSWKIYFRDVGPRFQEMGLSNILSHMATYPLELLGGALLPWSFFLIPLCSRSFRSKLDTLRDDFLFALVAAGVTFPSVWLPPGASLRYYMPLYPVFAILVGIVFDRVSVRCADWMRPESLLSRYWRLLAVIMVGACVFVAGLSFFSPGSRWSQPFGMACLVLTFGGLGAVLLWKISYRPSPRSLQTNLVIASGFLTLLSCTVIPNVRLKISQHAEREVAQLRAALPPGTHLHSLGIAHHLFLYHLREHVKVLPPPESIQQPPPDNGYFCMTIKDGVVPPLPFHWEHVRTINCDRNQMKKPVDELIVGRAMRVPMTAGTE